MAAERHPPPAEAYRAWSYGETAALVRAWAPMRRRRRQALVPRQRLCGRSSPGLAAADWHAVAADVNSHCAAAGLGHRRTPSQCKGRMKTLCKTYDKELARPTASQWRWFPDLDAVLAAAPRKRMRALRDFNTGEPLSAPPGSVGIGDAAGDTRGGDAAGDTRGGDAAAEGRAPADAFPERPRRAAPAASGQRGASAAGGRAPPAADAFPDGPRRAEPATAAERGTAAADDGDSRHEPTLEETLRAAHGPGGVAPWRWGPASVSSIAVAAVISVSDMCNNMMMKGFEVELAMDAARASRATGGVPSPATID